MYDSAVIADLERLARANTEMLCNLKASANLFGKHEDWPWNGFVLSGATRGGSARWKNIVKPRYDTELSWAALSKLDDDKIKRQLKTIGRFKNKTGAWLWSLFLAIREAGGPANIRQRLHSLDAEGIIDFLTNVSGCGPKYSRNIMMDIYDERFHEGYFAIDSRIKGLLPRLKYPGKAKYEDQERFLIGLAAQVGIKCWELDRLLYNKVSEI